MVEEMQNVGLSYDNIGKKNNRQRNSMINYINIQQAVNQSEEKEQQVKEEEIVDQDNRITFSKRFNKRKSLQNQKSILSSSNSNANNKQFKSQNLEDEMKIERKQSQSQQMSQSFGFDYSIKLQHTESISNMKSIKNRNDKLRNQNKNLQNVLLIYPDDTLKGAWDFLINVALLYSCSVLIYRIAFYIHDPAPWRQFHHALDIIFSINLTLNFFTVFYNSSDNLITRKSSIACHYLKGWFLVDLLSSFPFWAIPSFAMQEDDQSGVVLEYDASKLYLWVRLTRGLRVLKILWHYNALQSYMDETFRIKSTYLRLLTAIIFLLWFCHITSCTYYILATLASQDQLQTWVYRYNFELSQNLEKYVAGYYFCLQTIYTVGYGDILAVTTSERFFTILLMITGLFVYTFLISSLITIFNSRDAQEERFKSLMGIVDMIQKSVKIETSLKKNIYHSLKHDIRHSKYELNYQDLIEGLPLHVRDRLMVQIFKKMVIDIPFLHDKDKVFISYICPLLKHITFKKGEYIFQQGEPVHEMYFITKGKVAGVLPSEQNDCEFIRVLEGYYFGEVDILFSLDKRREFSFKAVEDCEMYLLSCNDFQRIFFDEFKDEGLVFLERAYKRQDQTRQYYAEAQAKLKSEQYFAPFKSMYIGSGEAGTIIHSDLKSMFMNKLRPPTNKQQFQLSNKALAESPISPGMSKSFLMGGGSSQIFKQNSQVKVIGGLSGVLQRKEKESEALRIDWDKVIARQRMEEVDQDQEQYFHSSMIPNNQCQQNQDNIKSTDNLLEIPQMQLVKVQSQPEYNSIVQSEAQKAFLKNMEQQKQIFESKIEDMDMLRQEMQLKEALNKLQGLHLCAKKLSQCCKKLYEEHQQNEYQKQKIRKNRFLQLCSNNPQAVLQRIGSMANLFDSPRKMPTKNMNKNDAVDASKTTSNLKRRHSSIIAMQSASSLQFLKKEQQTLLMPQSRPFETKKIDEFQPFDSSNNKTNDFSTSNKNKIDDLQIQTLNTNKIDESQPFATNKIEDRAESERKHSARSISSNESSSSYSIQDTKTKDQKSIQTKLNIINNNVNAAQDNNQMNSVIIQNLFNNANI